MITYKIFTPQGKSWRKIAEFNDDVHYSDAIKILQKADKHNIIKITMNRKPVVYSNNGQITVIHCEEICKCKDINLCAAACYCNSVHDASLRQCKTLLEMKELCKL